MIRSIIPSILLATTTMAAILSTVATNVEAVSSPSIQDYHNDYAVSLPLLPTYFFVPLSPGTHDFFLMDDKKTQHAAPTCTLLYILYWLLHQTRIVLTFVYMLTFCLFFCFVFVFQHWISLAAAAAYFTLLGTGL